MMTMEYKNSDKGRKREKKPAQICGSPNSNSKLVTFSGISDQKH